MLCDGRGLPLATEVLAGPAHESKPERVHSLLEKAPRLRRRARRLLADRGYDTLAVRALARRRRLRAVIPEKRRPEGHRRRRRGRPPSCPPALYRRRNAIERLIGWLKEHRRLATRFEKLAVRFAAMLDLAFLKRLLQADLSDTA